jgi:diamine N-acetyltransferase
MSPVPSFPTVRDRAGRSVTLTGVTEENWRDVADVAPADGQRQFVAPLAARYLLLSMREDEWTSLGVLADDAVVGHVMWGRDDDGSHWIGGLVVAAGEQGTGVGTAAMRVLVPWLLARPGCEVVRLSYRPANNAARALYARLGFTELDLYEDDEVVAELTAGAWPPPETR